MKRGQITVFVSLLLPLLLAVLGMTLESAYQQCLRSRIQRSLILGEISFLSEYQKDLWERYGLFYLDTGYGTKKESEDTIKSRLLTYLGDNLQEPFLSKVSDIKIGNFSRLTDKNGMGFYEQAVAFEKHLWGADLIEDWLKCNTDAEKLQQQGERYQEANARETKNLEVLNNRQAEKEEVQTRDPRESLPVKNSVLSMVVSEKDGNVKLSSRAVSLELVPSRRELLEGSGTTGYYPGNFTNDQWFHTYLLERYSNAGSVLLEEREAGQWLAYELEYILCGKSSDRENLKGVVNRLLLLREGANYAYLMADEGKKQEAYTLAAVLVGLTGLPELVDVVHQILLLGWAYGESILDVRALLQGNQVSVVKTADSWKLSLGRLFVLPMYISAYDDRSDTKGVSYEGYLRMLLSLQNRSEKCMRALDVIEGNLRTTDLGKYFYADQCVDGISLEVSFWSPYLFCWLADINRTEQGHEMTAERRFSYEWW